MKKFSVGLFSAMLAGWSLSANTPFTVTNQEDLQISWRGKPLVIGEKFNYLEQNGFAGSEKRNEERGSPAQERAPEGSRGKGKA